MPRQTDESYYTIAESWVARAVDQVTSADKFFALLQHTPDYIPRRIARDVWSSYGEQTAWAAFRETRDPESPMLRRFFSDRPSYAREAYNVKVKYTGFDPNTGQAVDSYVTLGFAHPPTMAEVGNWALAETDYQPLIPADQPFQWNVEYLYHREDMPW